MYSSHLSLRIKVSHYLQSKRISDWAEHSLGFADARLRPIGLMNGIALLHCIVSMLNKTLAISRIMLNHLKNYQAET